jgi:hypothetical protein
MCFPFAMIKRGSQAPPAIQDCMAGWALAKTEALKAMSHSCSAMHPLLLDFFEDGDKFY